MYSVIIQTKETMDAFSAYKPLFIDAVADGTVGFCRWIETGKNIDDALPGLRELTDNKKEWRAVIVRLGDEEQEAGNEAGEQNPYDYIGSGEPEDDLEESSIPLIRLTHMLGGVPPIEKKFKSVLIEEPNMEPKTIYEPIEEKEREEAYKNLKEKYEFDGILPSSIVIITIREARDAEEEASAEWNEHYESQSSGFWKRNRYPSICRFLVFDFVRQGPVRREEDFFRFWLSVLLLSVNKIDSASLQAYRLYRVNTFVDSDLMAETFQRAVNRVASAKSGIKSAIDREARGITNADESLPDFRIEVPVAFNIPQNMKCTVKTRRFRPISTGIHGDIAEWEKEKKQAEDNLVRSVRIADRALDKTAKRMKDSCKYDEDAVLRLDAYQREDLVQETDLIYRDMIELQGKLPTAEVTKDKESEEISKSVRNYLRGRITLMPIIYTFVFGILIAICMQIPAIVQYINGGSVSVSFLVVETLIPIVAMLLCGIGTLLFQKSQLIALIKGFNRKMKAAFNKIQVNAKEYSQYLTAVASHSRGRSYLSLSDKKDNAAVDVKNMRYKHLAAIDAFLSRLKVWSEAFHLDIEYKRPEINDEAKVDVTIPPAESLLYSVEPNKNCRVEMNKSGMSIDSPFTFINKFELVREELYDDDGR